MNNRIADQAGVDYQALHAHLLKLLGVRSHEEAGGEIGRLHGNALRAEQPKPEPVAIPPAIPEGYALFQIGGPCKLCGRPNIEHGNGQCPQSRSAAEVRQPKPEPVARAGTVRYTVDDGPSTTEVIWVGDKPRSGTAVYLAPPIPPGYRVAPIEPTYEMVQAGAKLVKDNLPAHTGTRDIYAAMLAVATVKP